MLNRLKEIWIIDELNSMLALRRRESMPLIGYRPLNWLDRDLEVMPDKV